MTKIKYKKSKQPNIKLKMHIALRLNKPISRPRPSINPKDKDQIK